MSYSDCQIVCSVVCSSWSSMAGDIVSKQNNKYAKNFGQEFLTVMQEF